MLDHAKRLPDVHTIEITDGFVYSVRSDKWRLVSKRLNTLLADLIPILPAGKKITLLVSRSSMPRVLSTSDDNYHSHDAEYFTDWPKSLAASRCLRTMHESGVPVATFYTSNESFVATGNLVPIFSARKLDCFQDILMPGLFDYRHKPDRLNKGAMNWSAKMDKLLMLKVSFMRKKKNYGVKSSIRINKSISIEVIHDTVAKKSVKSSYKYVLVADESLASGELVSTLAGSGGSLIFFSGAFTQWFTSRLTRWLHYVPIRLNGSDMDENLKWSVLNDRRAREIGDRGLRLAREKLRVNDMKCYMGLLLLEYAELIKNE
jgi:hypothetical protein